MIGSVNGRWPNVVACALAALWMIGGEAAQAAPAASAFGPQALQAEPKGGYVGQLDVAPDHGPAGTPLTVTAQGLPADQEFQLVWRTVNGSWKVGNAEYKGREYKPVGYEIAKVKTDAAGRLTRDLHDAGGFRLRPRHRAAAGRPAVHPGRLLARHDVKITPEERPGRHADHVRGQGHRLAAALQLVGPALRQQFHRLDVGGDDRGLGDLHHPGDRHRGRPHHRSGARRVHLPLSQPAAEPGARPAALDA